MTRFVFHKFPHDLDVSSRSRLIADIEKRLGYKLKMRENYPCGEKLNGFCLENSADQGNLVNMRWYGDSPDFAVHVRQDEIFVDWDIGEIPLSVEFRTEIQKLQGSKADDKSPSTLFYEELRQINTIGPFGTKF